MSINFTLWPNPEGPLGKNKVTIPDGINVTWPEGDALVGNFVYNEGKLVGFVDTMALVANESKSTTIPYDFVDITVDKSLESSMAFIPGERCKDLNISYAESGNTIVLGTKYLGCKTVDDVKAVDSNYQTTDIIDGVWKEGLGDLTIGTQMFQGCKNLTTFYSDLSSLTTCQDMFYGCSNLTSFKSDLSSLTFGHGMFSECFNLESFSSDLSSLTYGTFMFYGCKLDTASVQNIADTIKDVSSVEDEEYCGMKNKTILIDIGNTTPNEQEDAAFNKMASKGWTVYANGSEYTPTSPAAITTLDETGQEITTPIPYWAKPIISDEERARYVDSEGNFYNILGAQFIYGDDLSTYGMFTCEEDAAANMRLTKIEK